MRYTELAILAEGVRQADVAEAHRIYTAAEALRPDAASLRQAEALRNSVIKAAERRYHDRLAVAAAAHGVTRDRAPGDASNPEAVAWLVGQQPSGGGRQPPRQNAISSVLLH